MKINFMQKVLYTDLDGSYALLDYNRSHSQLLLRKRKDGVNTDILFKSVQFIVIPILLHGIEISLIDNPSELKALKETYSFDLEYGYRVYSVTNANKDQYFLNAGVFGIFKNELDILESSVGDFTWSSLSTLIFWSD